MNIIIASIPLIASLIIFPFLPETIPHHFGSGGEPDAWAGKWSAYGILGLFLLPVISLVMFYLLNRLAPLMQEIAKDTGQNVSPNLGGYIVLLTVSIFLAAHIWILSLVLSNI